MTVKNFAKSIFKPFKKLLLTSEISPKWRKFAECGHTVGYTRRRRRRRRRHRRHRRRRRRHRRRHSQNASEKISKGLRFNFGLNFK